MPNAYPLRRALSRGRAVGGELRDAARGVGMGGGDDVPSGPMTGDQIGMAIAGVIATILLCALLVTLGRVVTGWRKSDKED